MGKYLKENNIQVSGYYSKREHSAKEAAIFTNTKYYKNLINLINDSDAIFITTPDDQISEVWNEIKEMPIKNKLICHCSGSLTSEIFSNISEYGAYGYSIHPIFAISDKYNSYKNLSKAFITIEGNEKYAQFIEALFYSLGNSTSIISKENKTVYHAACVQVSNLMLALVNNGVKYLNECGFPEEIAIKALYPLIEFNLKNVKENGIIKSLTGPIERGDLNIIKSHLKVLNGEDKELYKLLSRNILEIAKVKNPEKSYEKLDEYLGDNYEKYSNQL